MSWKSYSDNEDLFLAGIILVTGMAVMTGITVYKTQYHGEEVELHSEMTSEPPCSLFVDGFEDGTASAWSHIQE